MQTRRDTGLTGAKKEPNYIPYHNPGDSGSAPLRYTNKEWIEKIEWFIKGEGHSLIYPGEQSIVAVIFDDEGKHVNFWTEDYAGSGFSEYIETYNGGYDQIDWEYCRRNPPPQIMHM